MNATVVDDETTSVTAVMATLARTSAPPFATSTRDRRGSTRKVEVMVP